MPRFEFSAAFSTFCVSDHESDPYIRIGSTVVLKIFSFVSPQMGALQTLSRA